MTEPHSLTEALAEMERTHPDVAKASLAYDVMVSRLTGCRHLLPCRPGRCTGVYAVTIGDAGAPDVTSDEVGQ